jgi:hypothetical protein
MDVPSKLGPNISTIHRFPSVKLEIFLRTLVAFLLSLPITAALAQTAILKDPVTPLYEKPSTNSRLLAVLAAGDTVRILKTSGPWVHVLFHRKRTGWLNISGKSASASKAESDASGEESRWRNQPQAAPALGGVGNGVRAATDGGISFHLGTFSGDFTYVGKFYYRSLPSIYLEGTFQYVAGQIASLYLLYGNAKYIRRLGQRIDGSLTAGAGVINTVPIRSAGGKSVSNMAVNFGLGIQRHLKNYNWLRLDLRQYSAVQKRGLANFIEFTVGISIGVRWSKL